MKLHNSVRSARGRTHLHRRLLHSTCRLHEFSPQQIGYGVYGSGGGCSWHGRGAQQGDQGHGGGNHPQEREASFQLVGDRTHLYFQSSRRMTEKSFKRVRLTKKTPYPLVYRVSLEPIPDARFHDPSEIFLLGLGGWLPGGCRGLPVLEADWIRKELVE